MTDTFVFHSDPGHAWLEVSVQKLWSVGLRPQDFSVYSYRRGDRCFLEEDCDAPLFLETYRKVFGERPMFKEVNMDRQHWIRDLPSIGECAA